jgi:UDP-N-acetylmuramate dehydrogenase
MLPIELIDELKDLVSCEFYRDFPLDKLSSWKIGGKASLIIRPNSSEQVIELIRFFIKHNIPYLTIGLTTNLLFCDEGVQSPIIQLAENYSRVWLDDHKGVFKVNSGCWTPGFSRYVQRNGYTGAEHTCGIPGTIGGLVCMNGGSLRQCIGDAVVDVKSVDTSGELRLRSQAECEFGYRQSVFQRNEEVILEARFKFEKTKYPGKVRKEMLSIIKSRNEKFPRKTPNCGSVFKSNPVMYNQIGAPGKVIEGMGLKGYSVGMAEVSNHHANFIINKGGATSHDVVELIEDIRGKVYDTHKIVLEAEVKYVDYLGKIKEI